MGERYFFRVAGRSRRCGRSWQWWGLVATAPWEIEPEDESFDFSAELLEDEPPSPTGVEDGWRKTARRVTTAAELAGAKVVSSRETPPDVFTQGMTVVHPEHGVGKIVALSGSGAKRRATVRFATAGEKRFVLAHSPLRPAGR